jgi:diadenylate cyclase
MPTWLFESMELSDLLDILLVSFILYQTLLLLRGTRAVQSLAGLLILVVLFELSGLIGMSSMAWLLDKFFVYIVLVIIILFQNDIRRALARAGGRFSLSISRTATEVSVLESLTRASFQLASRRMGALIVIERHGDLQEFVEPASVLDAMVSESLLLSIFHPTSPLHDGAVILRKERILAAQAFLPLTLSKDVSRFMGTRHRAAIGLTEETDAIVILVSEERGTVSVVSHGTIRPTRDANELRETLQELLHASSGPALSPAEAEA